MGLGRQKALQRLLKFALRIEEHFAVLEQSPEHLAASLGNTKSATGFGRWRRSSIRLEKERAPSGVSVSRSARHVWRAIMIPPDPELVARLEKLFDQWQGSRRRSMSAADYRRLRYDFAFHMTDWLGDLRKVHAIFFDPKNVSQKSVDDAVVGFLFHAIPHLNAAGRLLLEDIPDAFANHYKEWPTKKATKKALRKKAG
jgi:hypothetical protein